MRKCWNDDPWERPTFEDLVESLSAFLEQSNENYGYVKLLIDADLPDPVEKIDEAEIIAKKFSSISVPSNHKIGGISNLFSGLSFPFPQKQQ